MADFPDVPDVPGVPALLRDPASAVGELITLTADALDLGSFAIGQQWGIFLDGEPVVLADTVMAVDYKQNWTLATYPLEQGAFETYDKVASPFDVRVRFAAGGSLANRQAFLDSIIAIAGDLNTYDVVTPEAVLQSVNVGHYSYDRRPDHGLGLISVDIYLQEIRVTATAQFSTASAAPGSTGGDSPSQTQTQISIVPGSQLSAGASPLVNGGTVQPVTPSASDNAAFSKNLQDAGFPTN